MIDTHAHVGEMVIETEVDWTKLKSIVLSGTSLADSIKNIELARENTQYLASIGYHPENIKDDIFELVKLAKENRHKIVAIGECGLDALCTDVALQQERFEVQVGLAIELDLPLIIHARKLNDEIIEILKKYPKHRGVFHCYTGGKKRIEKILELGEWYFGIDGNVTYEPGLEEVVKLIPQDRLLCETDCPYLTPLPYRGEKNYPQYVEFVYKKIGEIWQKNFEETETILDKNAGSLFNKIV